MDVVDAGTDFIRVVEVLKRLQQVHVRSRGFDGDHIGIQRRDSVHNVVKFAVTHMGVNLGFIPRHRRIQSEGLHRPVQVGGPFRLVQWQTFTQRRLINLDNPDARLLQVFDFITQRQRDLFRDGFA